jgi:hypothetical protein
MNCINYFPNATKLTFSGNFSPICHSIESNLTHIIPIKQITKLIIDQSPFSFIQMVQLLSFMVNIHTLKLASISLNEINSGTIQQNDTFQLVSITNIVKNVILEGECSLERIELLIALCPRLKHLTINGFAHSLLSIIRVLLSKNNNNNRYLSSLCILEIINDVEENMNMMIEIKKLLNDFSIKYNNRKLYLWW